MTREEATRRNTMPNELKPNRSGKEVVSFYEWAVKMAEKEVDGNEP